MKKFILSLLMIILLIGLIFNGCGSPASVTTPTQAPTPTKASLSTQTAAATVPMPWDNWPVTKTGILKEWNWPSVFITNGMATRYADAVAHAQILKKYSGIETQAVQLSSGAAAVIDVIKGKIHIAETNTGDINASYFGVRDMEGVKPGSIAVLFISQIPSLRGLIVRTGSGIKTPYDLKGKKVGRAVSIPIYSTITEALITGHGLSLKDVNFVPYTETSELASALREGLFDAVFFSVDPGTPMTTDLTVTGDAYLVSIDPSKADACFKATGGLYPIATLPGGTFKGQNTELLAFSGRNGTIVNADLPESLAYSITRIFWSNLAEYHSLGSIRVKEYTAVDKNVDPQIIVAGFHPGAIRYYKEIGVWGTKQQEIQQELENQVKVRLAEWQKNQK